MMVQPLVRNGHILPNEQQPTDYLLTYADNLLEVAASRILDVVGTGEETIQSLNVFLNRTRDILHILQEREGWRESGDGGYK